MNKKRSTALLLCLALIISMLSSPEQLLAKKAKLRLNKKKVTLYVGKSVRLKVKGTKKKVKWKSSSKKVATVSSKGKVKAKKKGKARIIAKIGKKKLVCKVTVKKAKSSNSVLPGATEGSQTTSPTASATDKSTASPTGGATDKSTASPTAGVTKQPTASPTAGVTKQPTASPTTKPTEKPTASPTTKPTEKPTASPTTKPTEKPTASPTTKPTEKPTASPTATPTVTPTIIPTETPFVDPTPSPTSPVKIPALSINTSFENGADGYAAQGSSSIRVADNGYNGNCLAIEGRTTETDGVVYAIDGEVVAGESYTVQGYVKSASESATMKCLFQYGEGTEDCQEFATVEASGEWIKFRGTFTVPANFTNLDICFEMSGTDSFYLDEVSVSEIVSIKDTYDSVFGKMGTCINPNQLEDEEVLSYVKKHYSSITLENDMKPDYLLPSWMPLIDTKTAQTKTGDYVIPESYTESKVPTLNYRTIDKVLKIAKENGLKIRYHVLLWHSQSPEWFFKENYSQEEDAAYVSEEVMYARMEMYIRSVIHHVYTLDGGAYKDVVYAWDVANEYFSNTPDKNWSAVFGNREGNLGNRPPFIKRAFEIAHDELEKFSLADTISLFYNDFNTYLTTDKIIEMIHYINSDETVCDGIGMQSHLGVTFPSVDWYVETVQKFIEEGFEVQITELDVGCNEETLETDVTAAYEEQAAYVGELTEKLIAVQKASNYAITGMTWWGMYDSRSWRSNHVLMFDTSLYDAKPSYFAFIEAAGAVEKPVPTPTPVVTIAPTAEPTATPVATPKYTPPAETAPPVVSYDFTDENTYRNESPSSATSVVNADGSLTITFTGRYAAFNFYLPDNAQNYYSNYQSAVLTYTSEGGNLGHALYDINMEGMDGNSSAGKHPDWSQKIVESPDKQNTLILNVTEECEGGCIRGLQIFNPNVMEEGKSITITIHSLKFYDTVDPAPEETPEPTATAEPTATPTAIPTETPKYTPPAETAPPVVSYDFTDENTYRNESPSSATSVVNADGSLTITFTGRYAAFNFYLPDNAQNYYSNYQSVVLTYTSEGANLGHALYDINMEGMDGDSAAGKHPDWSQKIVESPDKQNTLILNVTEECEGGCIRGLQIFNPNVMEEGKSITITIHSLKFCDKINPTEEDYLTTE